MPKLNQKGVIHLLVVLILIAGLFAALYLVQKTQIFKPKAAGPQSVTPTTSFSFFSDAPGTTIGSQLAVKVLVRSDLAATNLFNAKINFPADILAVDHIDYAGTFVDSWIEQYFDNNSGAISLVGGVPSPGFSTDINSSAGQMAVIYFKVLKEGTPNISYADDAAIYSNADNLNILTNKLPINISIISGESVSSRIFITSTTYDGNLGGLSGADQKCQDRANAVNLTGEWKAWLSDGNSSASSRLIHNPGSYKLVNNASLVANNWSDLTDGSLLNPITLTENREFMDLVHGQKLVWTDTSANGDISSTDTRFNCNNWTSNSGSLDGKAGYVGSSASSWTTGNINPCSADWHLYCVEQVGNIITSPVPTPSPSSIPGYVTINYPQPEAGWNLIGVSVEPPAVQNYNAASLLSDSGCVEVDVWNNSSQGWNRYGSGAIFPSYLSIQGGKSYMMKCGSSGRKAFSIAGTPVNTFPTLSPGWNMAAVPYNSSYSNVSSFVNDFDSSIKSNIKEVDRYEAGGWDSYLTNLTVNNFPITKDRGYFIKYQPNSATVIAALSLPDSLPAPVATPLPTLGDGNGDSKINLIDLSILLSDFNKTNGFRKGIDMNGDGRINSFDFFLMRTLLIQKGVIKS